MKTSKIALTIFAFAFAVVAAFASTTMVLTSDDEGVAEDACSTVVDLVEDVCYTDGAGIQCSLVGSNEPAFLQTECSTQLKRLN